MWMLTQQSKQLLFWPLGRFVTSGKIQFNIQRKSFHFVRCNSIVSTILEYKAKTTYTTLSVRFKIHMKIHWNSTFLTMWYTLFLLCTLAFIILKKRRISFYVRRPFPSKNQIESMHGFFIMMVIIWAFLFI
jgi:hypothetical protein